MNKLVVVLLGIIVVLGSFTAVFAYNYYETYSTLEHSMNTLGNCMERLFGAYEEPQV